MNYEERFIHDAAYSSLREHMVTLEEWVEQVLRVENINPYVCAKLDYDKNNAKRVYVQRYPFALSVWSKIAQVKYPGVKTMTNENWLYLSLDRKACNDWDAEYNARVKHFIDNMISEDTLQMWDSDNNIGIIQHTQTGVLFPFEYDKIKGFELRTIPVALQYYMITNFLNDPNLLNKETLLSYLYQCRDNYSLFYEPIFNTPEGDYFHHAGSIGNVTDARSYTVDEVNETIEFMRNMIELHAKVIRLG